jgi:Uma2 family endonuclease
MAELARKNAVYEDLYTIPENMTGEIIDGDLYAHPRPARRHIYAASALGVRVSAPYQFGDGGGPGGWIILYEPEIGLGGSILVPDFAGWKRERYPDDEGTSWISIAPDWVCEVISLSTARVDKVRKMPIYARNGVAYAWLVDPVLKTLDAFRLEAGRWMLLGSHGENDCVRVEPFQELELNLGDLWR